MTSSPVDSLQQEADALEALEKKATPAPWHYAPDGAVVWIEDPHNFCPTDEMIIWPSNSISQDGQTMTAKQFLGSCGIRAEQDAEANLELLLALRNRAMPLIRALRERVRKNDEHLAEVRREFYQGQSTFHGAVHNFKAMQARIESLEAERDIWRERLLAEHEHETGDGRILYLGAQCLDPTPSEIAARIQQKKTEAKP